MKKLMHCHIFILFFYSACCLGGDIEDNLHQGEDMEELAVVVERAQGICANFCTKASCIAAAAIAWGWATSSGASLNNLDPKRFDCLVAHNYSGGDETLTLADPEIKEVFWDCITSLGYGGALSFRYLASLYNMPNNITQTHNVTSDVTDNINIIKKAKRTGKWREAVCDLRNTRAYLEIASLLVSIYCGYLFTRPDYRQASRFANFTGIPLALWGVGASASGGFVWKGLTDFYVKVVTHGLIPLFTKKNKRYLKSVGLDKLTDRDLMLYSIRKIVTGVVGLGGLSVMLFTKFYYGLYRYQGLLLAPQETLETVASDHNLTVAELADKSLAPDYQAPGYGPEETAFIQSLGVQATPELFFLNHIVFQALLWTGGKLMGCCIKDDEGKSFEWPDPHKEDSTWYVSFLSPSDREHNEGCSKRYCLKLNSAPAGYTSNEKRMALIESFLQCFFIPLAAMYVSNLENQDTQAALTILKANPYVALGALLAPMFSGYMLNTIPSTVKWEKYPQRQALEHLKPGFKEDDEYTSVAMEKLDGAGTTDNVDVICETEELGEDERVALLTNTEHFFDRFMSSDESAELAKQCVAFLEGDRMEIVQELQGLQLKLQQLMSNPEAIEEAKGLLRANDMEGFYRLMSESY